MGLGVVVLALRIYWDGEVTPWVRVQVTLALLAPGFAISLAYVLVGRLRLAGARRRRRLRRRTS